MRFAAGQGSCIYQANAHRKTAHLALTWLPSERGTAGCYMHGTASHQLCVNQGPSLGNACTSVCRLSCRRLSGLRLGPGRRCAQCCHHWTQQSATCRSCGGFWGTCSVACKPAQARQVCCSGRIASSNGPCWWAGVSVVCKSCVVVLERPFGRCKQGSAEQARRAKACLAYPPFHKG